MNDFDFKTTLFTARTKNKWSHQTLAKKSKVSSRTIFELEKGAKSMPRPTVVVKLAVALKQDPKKWLQVAGHKQLSEDQLREITKEIGGFRFMGEIVTEEFFAEIRTRLEESKMQILICAAYPCVPSALHREDVQRFFIERLQTGRVKFAMVIPYPEIKDIRLSKKPHLAAFYRSVQDEVFRLAKELSERLNPPYKEKIMLFMPKIKENYLIPPNLTLSEYRTSLIRYQADKPATPPDYELVTWATVVHDGTDRVMRLYPLPELGERANNLMVRWKDYFSEVIAYCDSPEKSRKELSEWEAVAL